VRILIVKRDKLGDLLLTTPVLAHLKSARPDAELHLLANDYNAWVARDHAALSRTWTFPRVRQGRRLRVGAAIRHVPLALELKRQRFDWVLVMGGDESHRAIKRALAVGGARTVAYASAPGRYGARLTDPLPPPSSGHEVTRMLALLAPLGLQHPPSLVPPSFSLPAAARSFADDWLAARGLARDRYVVIGLGARRAKKQPSTQQLVRWTTRLHRDFGLPTIFMWTPGKSDDPGYPGDDAIAEPFVAQRLAHVHPFRGPIPEALGLIFGARSSIFPDSGLMHFAAASEGGVLGLFADPQDSAPASRWAPMGPRAAFIEAEARIADVDDEEIFAKFAPLLRRDTPI
jgi:ADP-heptose:LPS heptosyltransferase